MAATKMNRYQMIKLYNKIYPKYAELLYINTKEYDTEEALLKGINEQIDQIKTSQTTWNKIFMPTELQDMLKEALQVKEAYKEYIEGAWKSEPLEEQIKILKSIAKYICEQSIDPYYNECMNQLKTKQLVLLKQRITEPIPEPLTGEVYTIAISSDPYRIRSTYDIKELYIPYYGLHTNVSQGFNVFLASSNRRGESPPLKTVEIPSEMAQRIYNAAKELSERDVLKKYVEGLLKDESESESVFQDE